MAELGYVEGKNFAAELRVNPDSLTQAAANLVGLNVNVIFVPLISLFDAFPKNGGLLAYGPNVSEMFRRCGIYVGKILQGALAAASKATTSIPVVGIDLESDPIAKGYVKSLGRPGQRDPGTPFPLSQNPAVIASS
jgi:putative ABC transport system substrate-binding protein